MKFFGQGAFNVGGHKVSYGLLAALAGIAGAVLIFLQMRNAGSSVGAGSMPYTDAAGNVYDANGNLISAATPSGSASGSDWQSAFQSLSSQIGALSAGTTSAAVPSAPSSPAQVAASAGYANYGTQWGNTGAQTGGGSKTPTAPLIAASAPVTSPERSIAIISVPITEPGGYTHVTGPSGKPTAKKIPDVQSVDYLAVPYYSIPSLNQANPVSDYGRGN